MGLCTYFINGNCRFGSKCVNDHIDLKTLLKNEAEAVLNGKQWLLSCFGPFKESVVVPNFIPDQSFEEVRIAFMENSKNGNVQNYVNNLMMEYNNAQRKLNELRTPSSDTLQLIASIYNTSNSNDQKPKPAQSQVPNPFQSSNIFGGNTQQQTMPSSSIFGASSTTQNNPFQQATPQQPASSLFASSTNNQPQSSTFSSFNQAPQDPQKSSIFGQSSIFSSAQNQNPASVFSNNQSNIFGQLAFGSAGVQQPTQSIFGSSSVQSPPQSMSAQSMPAQSVFGGSMSIPVQSMPAQSVFGASTSTSQPSQNILQQQPVQNVFAAQAINPQQPVQNVFAAQAINPQQPAQNVFAAQAMNPQQPAQNVFAAQAINPQQPAQNVFASQAINPQQSAPNVFAVQTSNPQNIFGAFNQNQTQNQTFTQPTSVFGGSQASQMPQQSESMSGNIFNTQAPQQPQTSQIFGGNPFQQNVTFNDEHFYSKDEDLSPEQIQAFQAEAFIPGKIPILPPTKSLAYS